ncbi:MAG: hypothetical protein U5S82_02880 [Gammaproteobacteria bacterium]|nr:hypothetical protein [Gammaproteobacteria bacterium]
MATITVDISAILALAAGIAILTNGIHLIIASAFILSVMGCATIEGAGENLEAAGEAIEEEAEEERSY